MRDVAIVSFAQAANVSRFAGNEIELLLPVVGEAIARSGLSRDQLGVTVASSCDYLAGQAFAFVRALDAVGAHPVIDDSHLDMDGAWALYEAWVRLQTGEVDAALVYALGKTSAGRMHEIMPLSYDPYYVAPLMPDPVSLAALQARAVLDAGLATEMELAAITARCLNNAANNPNATRADSGATAATVGTAPYVACPLRAEDCPPVSDGAAAMVLAAGPLASQPLAWLRGVDHRVEAHALGVRDLTDSPSIRRAAEAAGVHEAPIELAELHTQYPHEEVIARRALGLGASVRINPSGGPQTANPVMATGLIRIGEAAQRVHAGQARRAVAHASAGPCLQQNLVCVLEAP